MKSTLRLFSFAAAVLLAVTCLLATGCDSTPAETLPVTETEATTEPETDVPATEPETDVPATEPSTEPETDVPATEPSTPTTTETWMTRDDPDDRTTKSADKTTKKPTAKTTTKNVSTTADWMKNYKSVQIINDPTFQNGFNVLDQVTTKTEGVWRNTSSTGPVYWELAQWGTFKSYTDRSGYISLLRDNISKVKNVLDNGMNRVEYNDKEKSLTLSMNSYDFFGGHGHTDNSSWPHLLIEQSTIDRMVLKEMEDDELILYTCAADKIILSLDVRMPKFRHEVYEGINACQLVSFYYIVSLRDSGFTWFGVPIFDDRGYSPSEKSSFVLDKGTNNFMYSVPCIDVYESTDPYGRYDFLDENKMPAPSDDWMHIELDLKPYIDEMAAHALKGNDHEIYPSTKTIDKLFIGGMNMGFEVHGTYDVAFEFKNYSLTLYTAKNK